MAPDAAQFAAALKLSYDGDCGACVKDLVLFATVANSGRGGDRQGAGDGWITHWEYTDDAGAGTAPRIAEAFRAHNYVREADRSRAMTVLEFAEFMRDAIVQLLQ